MWGETDNHDYLNWRKIRLYGEIAFADEDGTNRELEAAKRWEENYPDLASTLIKLHKDKPGFCGLDLHIGNVMMRGNTIVIIDPFVGDAG